MCPLLDDEELEEPDGAVLSSKWQCNVFLFLLTSRNAWSISHQLTSAGEGDSETETRTKRGRGTQGKRYSRFRRK